MKKKANSSALWNSPFEQIAGRTLDIPLKQVAPDPDQPRQKFRKKALEGLAASIKNQGLRQPITVEFIERRNGLNCFIIDAGERRWRAHGIIKEETISATVLKTPYKGGSIARQLAQTAENFQREPHTHGEMIALLKKVTLACIKETGKEHGAQTLAVRRIANALGEEYTWVNQYTLLARLSDEFIEMLDADDKEEALGFNIAIPLSNSPVNDQLALYKKSLVIKKRGGVNGQRSFIAREARKLREKNGDKLRGRKSDTDSRLLLLPKKLTSAFNWLINGKKNNIHQRELQETVLKMKATEVDAMLRELVQPIEELKTIQKLLLKRRQDLYAWMQKK